MAKSKGKSREEIVAEMLDELHKMGLTPGEVTVGQTYVFQEALGYIIGTAIHVTPFRVQLGSDSTWVYQLGDVSDYMRTGRVQTHHPIPFDVVQDHALRHFWPTPWPSPASE